MKITVTTRKTLTTKYGYTNQQITTSRKKCIPVQFNVSLPTGDRV